MFEKSGMEVYETMGTVWIEEERSYGIQDIERSNSIIRVRAYAEQLQQHLYSIHESMDLEDTVRSQRVEDCVQETLGN